jgi:hypothetical protein
VLLDLRGELARRRDDERARATAWLADEAMKDREQERCCLAAPRHRAREDVTSLDRGRNRVRLNRRRAGEPELLHATEEVGMQAE